MLFSGDSTYPLIRYLPEREGEWMVNSVLRNSLSFAMHHKCADEFERLRPDLLCPGHGPYWDVPPEAYAAHRNYAEQKEAIWRDLLPAPAELGIDLFWARLLPYQSRISRGDSETFTVELRNSFEEEATFDVGLTCGLDLTIEPASQNLSLAAGERGEVQFQVTAPQDLPHDPHRRRLITADLTVNGRRHGPISEALLVIPN